MNINDRYIVELSRAAIFDDMPKAPESTVDWDYIYKKSIVQNIAGLLYTAVDKLDETNKPLPELLEKWQRNFFETIALTSRQHMEFVRISKLAKEYGICFIGLKGCIMRTFYPVPELRTMGDFDILLQQKDVNKVKDLFKKQNYKIENDAFGIICSKGIIHWEIFTTIGEEFRVNTPEWDNKYYNSIFMYNGLRSVEPTEFLLHLIVHTAKHYIGSGAGIRNLLDIALFISKYKTEIDFKKIEDGSREQNYSNICRYIMTVMNKYFSVDIQVVEYMDDDKTENFLAYSLENGIFGKNDNALAVQAAKPEDDSISGFRKIFFPSVKSLKHRYKYLNTMPFLLPVAWVHRFLSALFRWKYSIKDMAKGLKEADEFSKHRLKKLKELKIK